MTEYGPFETERDAVATRAAASIRAAYDAAPGAGATFPAALKVMTDACEAAGVELGTYDLSPLRQMSYMEIGQCVSLAGIIRRAFEAGRAVGPDGSVTEWGVRRPAGESGSEVVHNCGEGGEAFARKLLRDHRRIYGAAGWVATRKIGPWTPAPEAATGERREGNG